MVEPSIPWGGGVDVTLRLGDEEVTQHCKMLDADAFDIIIGTHFLRCNHQVKLLSLQWPLLCPSGAVRTKRFWSMLREPVLSN